MNLKQSRQLLDNSRSLNARNPYQLGAEVQHSELANSALLDQAEQQVQQQLAEVQRDGTDNRGKLNEFFERQDVQRSKNVVSELGSNFDAAPSEGGKEKAGESFNYGFLQQNKLQTQGEVADDKEKGAGQANKPGQ
jgi:hypothetical protein